MVDLEFLILDLWNLARRCLAEEYILIGVCSQPRYYATPHSWGSGIYFIHYPMLTHGATLCRPHAWAQDLARLWRAGLQEFIITLARGEITLRSKVVVGCIMRSMQL